MNRARLLRAFSLSYFVAAMAILGARLAQDQAWPNAAVSGLTWALPTAVLFTLVRLTKYRRGQRCQMCGD